MIIVRPIKFYGFPLVFALAIAPGISIAFYIYFRDKHEPEPIPLLIISFFYGVLSVLLTLAITIPLNKLVTIHENSIGEQAIHAFCNCSSG